MATISLFCLVSRRFRRLVMYDIMFMIGIVDV